MRVMTLVCVFVILTAGVLQAQAVTLTFDYVPEGYKSFLDYYQEVYDISFDASFKAVDHTESTWGKPYSGKNVLMWNGALSYLYGIFFVEFETGHSVYANSVGGYFSTEKGTVLKIEGYGKGSMVSATIGASGKSWNNQYVQLDSADGINLIMFRETTTDALEHFCMDDLTVNMVPEPTSILALISGLAGLGRVAWRKRK